MTTCEKLPISGTAQIKPEFLRSGNRLHDDASFEKKGPLKNDSCNSIPLNNLNDLTKTAKANSQCSARHLKICPYAITPYPAETAVGPDYCCPYGAENCRYSHDISTAVSLKATDIGGDCHLLKSFGQCPAGALCRWSSGHREELLSPGQPRKRKLINTMSLPLQSTLRKRQFDFNCANNTSYQISKWVKSHTSKKAAFLGHVSDEDIIKLRHCEKKKIDFADKLLLAPLTTLGNLPFRRICKRFGADITCGEMAMASNLLQGKQSEWALLRRHPCEDVFGVQICGAHVDTMTRCADLINKTCQVDFVDINCGCPMDVVFQKGAGCGLLRQDGRLESIVLGMNSVLNAPVTVKMRSGIQDDKHCAHLLIPNLKRVGVSLITVHGRTRDQRYTGLADWNYIKQCVDLADPIPVFGNGDVLSYESYFEHKQASGCYGVAIGRGALIKPWLFTEIKESRVWDISSSERLEILRDFVNYGLEVWGSDSRGVETTRTFLLEWLSFLYRYIPYGILERVPQLINERPPPYFGRDDLETLFASPDCRDWIRISEMFLGPVPEGFNFTPKHKSNSFI